VTPPRAILNRHGGRRFFCPAIADTDRPRLDPANTHHLLHVLRAAIGDRVELFDGKGHVAEAELGATAPVQLRILSRRAVPRPSPRLAIASSPPAPNRFDTMAEKITELGIAEYIPVVADRRPPDLERRLRRGAARWEKITVEAAKQSGNPWLPTLSKPVTAGQLAAKAREELLLVAALQENAPGLRESLAAPKPAPRITAVVGPESGWSSTEISAFRTAGAAWADLGPHVLRVETAVLLLASVLTTFSRT
jgi:16S rRNA (uracil1498-N3)-methyltransferase